MKLLKNMYRFTNTDADISDSTAYLCLQAAENGDVKTFKKLYKELSKGSFGADYLQHGKYKLRGYAMDFTPYLKRFLVRLKHEEVYHVIYALNKTNIFDNIYITRSQITDIIEDIRYKGDESLCL